jgi:lipopolysaccharide transport system ATP-binding protein
MAEESAIIFVSHQMPQIVRICSRLMVMDKGRIAYDGTNIQKGIDHYHSLLTFEQAEPTSRLSHKGAIHSIAFYSGGGKIAKETFVTIDCRESLTVEIALSLKPGIPDAVAAVLFYDMEMRGGAECYSEDAALSISQTDDPSTIRVSFPELLLNPGVYSVSVIISDANEGETLLRANAPQKLRVTGTHIGFYPVRLQGDWRYR